MSRLNDVTPAEWDKVTAKYLVDNVNSPKHYNSGGIECIDYIKQQLGDGFIDYCQGNVIKYLHRWRYKNGKEDLEKAQWYLNRIVQETDL